MSLEDNCGSDNWKGAIHSNPELSIYCYDCGKEDSGNFEDYEKILKEWVK